MNLKDKTVKISEIGDREVLEELFKKYYKTIDNKIKNIDSNILILINTFRDNLNRVENRINILEEKIYGLNLKNKAEFLEIEDLNEEIEEIEELDKALFLNIEALKLAEEIENYIINISIENHKEYIKYSKLFENIPEDIIFLDNKKNNINFVEEEDIKLYCYNI